MIKAIFCDPRNTTGIENSNANYLMVHEGGLDQENWDKLKKVGMDLSIAFSACTPGECPANPTSWNKLHQKISQFLSFNPQALWLDHFRFDGHWESARGEIAGIHLPCQWCKDLDRAKFLMMLAQKIKQHVGNKTKVGYFAVPFKAQEWLQFNTQIGQDHQVLGRIFDQISPMLYHQMIDKPIAYISEYVSYLTDLTHEPILPIIQIKTMPDDLEDTITEDIIKQAFNEAIKPPSEGVAIFWWNHVLEKNKTDIIQGLFHT